MFQSSNGIAVNGSRLTPGKPHLLKDGDHIVIAIPPSDTDPEFLYTFHQSLKVKKVAAIDGSSDHVSSSQNSQENVPTQKRKRNSDDDEAGSSKHAINSPSTSKKTPLKRLCQKQDALSPRLDIRKQLEEQRRIAEDKFREQEEKLAQMKALLEEKDKAQEKMKEELKEKEEEMKIELQKQQACVFFL